MLLVALGCAPLGFSALPAPYNQEERWLIAATGQCSHQSYVQEEGGVVRPPEFEGDGFITAIANVAFDFFPSRSIEFTDAPYHKATALGSSAEQVEALQSSGWTKKNIALLEPQDDDWAISVFKVEENGPCADRTDCVHYRGWVSAQTPNFPHEGRDGTFPCQLFVDTTSGVLECDVCSTNVELSPAELVFCKYTCSAPLTLATGAY